MALYPVIILFTLCDIIIKYASTNASHFEVTACHENSSSLQIVPNTPRVVDVVPGSVVHLWCHFCDDIEDYFPKLWFYKPRGNKQAEILSDIENNDFSTKLVITPVHILNIHDFDENNSGIYTCRSPETTDKGNIFMYNLEGILNVEISPKVGTFIQWQEYNRNYLYTINKKFIISEEEPFKSLRKNLNKTLKLTTIWENWGECKAVDRQKGVRKRIGRCHIQPTVVNAILEIKPMDVGSDTFLSYLTDGYYISCRSLHLNKAAPKLSQILSNIPDFEEEEPCHVVKRVKHKINRKKHKTIKQVEENSHVTLSCTEAVSNSDLKWFKDAKLLNPVSRNKKNKNEEEPHISISANNSLHISHIRKNEEGNYSCLTNGKTVQVFEVIIVSKSKLLNQEFIRYSIYLGFVLSLAMTCYCAGVYVAWHRRSSFVDPLNINKKGTYEYHRLQREREKLLK
ncbi:hypothetical protein PYW08_015487 [Mythimna loreyi]|uniref:Uncharacterized protein n=1 Tax=Mythimna loreyi TaxID=667449 RepID=A0ACC2QYF5_9NEOP|nr:hypothetical protein PYW08_015487 [Mythimna loreyi]